MKDGMIKVAAITPDVQVANPQENAIVCAEAAIRAEKELGAVIIVLPELSLTAYTCGDLFLSDHLQRAAEKALEDFCIRTKNLDALIFVGLPHVHQNKLYNCAACVQHGMILGVVPKANIPNYGSCEEGRYFSPAEQENTETTLCGQRVPFGRKLLFACRELPELVAAAEICEDLWVPVPSAALSTLAGATVICNLSAGSEIVGKAETRRLLLTAQSARLTCAYVYADAGRGESTTDLVYAGHNMVAENGNILAESLPFGDGLAVSELDCAYLSAKRRQQNTFHQDAPKGFCTISFSLPMKDTDLTRKISDAPFIPENPELLDARCEKILSIQAHGLAKRLAHIHGKAAVLGLSGGLDSTLALLVTVRAFDLLGLDRSGILAITMPGFGTTDRTYQNALTLAGGLGVTLKEISIVDSVRQHFADIGHDINVHDVTYENAQARERTQILMDAANQCGGLVIGTGDLSELALGWATYNGDHMSMYGVNGSVPKTLVRHLVAFEARHTQEKEVQKALLDVLDTPVSPELLPAKDGKISQKTEELVGPYELHDFFLYHFMRAGSSPSKMFRFAVYAFGDRYAPEVIKKWLVTFLRRFFNQQFKRSCLPDGPKVGNVCLSPRGGWQMPSDASSALWLKEAENIALS